MSKVLDATSDASGKVTADGVEVPGAIVLSEGTKASSGIVIIDQGKAWYFPSSASDIKDLITLLGSIIEKVGLIATTLDGVTVSPGSAAAQIAELTALKAELDSSKEALK